MKKSIIFLSAFVVLTIVNIPYFNNIEGLNSQIVSEKFSIANSNSGGCESVVDTYTMGGCHVSAFDCYPGGPLAICWKGQYMQCNDEPATYGWEEPVNCN
jgi:hypothetical protein